MSFDMGVAVVQSITFARRNTAPNSLLTRDSQQVIS